MLRIKCLIV